MEDFLEKQKERLITLRKEIEGQLLSFAKKDKKIKENWRSQFPEFDGSETGGSYLEVAQDEVEEYVNRLPLEHLLELKLKDINLAIEKIEKGEYGICERCKKKIKKSRLKIQPEARFCLKCLKK